MRTSPISTEDSAVARFAKHRFVKNELLAALSVSDLAAIGPLLEPILLTERMTLQEANKRVEHVYFVEAGLVSIQIVASRSILETALVGYRGAVGLPFLLGGHIPTHQSVVVLAGNALKIRSDELSRRMNERPSILERFSQYVQALNTHCAHMGACGVRHELEERLACWACLACDATGCDVLRVTHDYIAVVLGLRRAGVTEALIRFEEQGLIRKMRGVLEICDRKRLGDKACSCYGIISSSYAAAEHLIGAKPRPNELPPRSF